MDKEVTNHDDWELQFVRVNSLGSYTCMVTIKGGLGSPFSDHPRQLLFTPSILESKENRVSIVAI